MQITRINENTNDLILSEKEAWVRNFYFNFFLLSFHLVSYTYLSAFTLSLILSFFVFNHIDDDASSRGNTSQRNSEENFPVWCPDKDR